MFKKIITSFAYSLSCIIIALQLSWYVLGQMNFSYGFWHDHTSIAWAIETYAAANRQGHNGFEKTTKAERERVFAEIAKSIRSSGVGLEQIQYRVEGEAERVLLTQDEVLHLQDVAKLIDLAPFAVVPAWLVLCGLILYSLKKNLPMPSMRVQLASLAAVSAVIGVILAVIGPKAVFTQLHIWVFPAEHKWFFYYQDSLMSTMMHAPILFGGIAAQWAAFASIVFIGLQLAIKHWVGSKRRPELTTTQ
ncbi:MAG TPA: DUF1461 domain-containing protein [Cellvibrionaceae bacterium]|nr:DUF1461 domain-containing protein [Cellvibrionaceae bacterium]